MRRYKSGMHLLGLSLVLFIQFHLTISQNTTSRARFDNFKVYHMKIDNDEQLSFIKNFINLTEKYNFWKNYDALTKEVHIMVSPTEINSFEQSLRNHQIQSQIAINNVQELIDDEDLTNAKNPEFGWTAYYDLSKIESWLDNMLTRYPNITESFILGESYEGRKIRGIKISYKENNPGIFIESNIHAREWISSASATWFINQLLTSEDGQVRNLAENYDWYIVPVLNVDGFEYSHTTNRFWRKTRQPNHSNCIGTDPNRNFDVHWMENNGASSNPCDEIFAGPLPWSEPETRALASYLKNIKDKFNIYLALHSYSQLLLSPYGHRKDEFPGNYGDLLRIGAAYSDAVAKLPCGTNYGYGSSASILYVATGNSVDWVFEKLSKKIAFTIELRDKGRFCYLLPPQQIIPTCEELMTGIIALVDESKKLGYL